MESAELKINPNEEPTPDNSPQELDGGNEDIEVRAFGEPSYEATLPQVSQVSELIESLPSGEERDRLLGRMHNAVNTATKNLKLVGATSALAFGFHGAALSEESPSAPPDEGVVAQAKDISGIAYDIMKQRVERDVGVLADKDSGVEKVAGIARGATYIPGKIGEVVRGVGAVVEGGVEIAKPESKEKIEAGLGILRVIPGNVGKIATLISEVNETTKELDEIEKQRVENGQEGTDSVDRAQYLAKKLIRFVIDLKTLGLGSIALDYVQEKFSQKASPTPDPS